MNAIFAYSAYPLQLFINIGVVIILLAFSIVVHIIVQEIQNKGTDLLVEGLIALFLFMGGLQIILLSIIGEYVGRNYIENKNRPLYIIKKTT